MNEIVRSGEYEVVVVNTSAQPVAQGVIDIVVQALVSGLIDVFGRAVAQTMRDIALTIRDGWTEIGYEVEVRRLRRRTAARSLVLDVYFAEFAQARSRGLDADLLALYEEALRDGLREDLRRVQKL